MIEKVFDSLGREDIEMLVSHAVPEGRTLEYKQQLAGGSDEECREFLADVSSFANASGGDIIYGIQEQKDAAGQPTGVPMNVLGLNGINPDSEKGRMENRLRDGIDPRIPGVRMKHIDGFPSGPVIILRIPKSWAAPHMVKFKSLSRFHSRNGGGKYQLDVNEIRSSFLASAQLLDKIRAFRYDRIARIASGDLSLSLAAGAKLALHVLPLRGFSEPEVLDIRAARAAWPNTIKPMGQPTQWGPPEFNFEGLQFSGGSSGSIYGYIQLFRNGAIEAVCARIAQEKLVSGVAFEQELMREAPNYLKFQSRLGFEPPLVLALSLLGVKGAVVVRSWNLSPDRWQPMRAIERDVLLAPETVVDASPVRLGESLRPSLDSFWQASGWPGSQGFDGTGQWVGYAGT